LNPRVTVISATLIAISMLALGSVIGYNTALGKTTTQTQTVTDTSSVVIIQAVTTTRIISMSSPKIITVSGTVRTDAYVPVEISFRVCYYGNLSGILGSAFCGNQNYSSPISNVENWTLKSTLPITRNALEFNGTYTVQVPNNFTYDISLTIRSPNQTNSPSNYEKLDVLRLPVYSVSPNISNYQIGCGYTAGNYFYYCVD
jgi:hypothetical protein